MNPGLLLMKSTQSPPDDDRRGVKMFFVEIVANIFLKN